MEPEEPLVGLLIKLNRGELAELLANRPDALDAPWPRRMSDLGDRLCQPESIELAITKLTAPELQVLSVIQLKIAQGDHEGVAVSAVAELLGTTDRAIGEVVGALSRHALAWLEYGVIQVPTGMPTNGHRRFRLGRPLAHELASITVEYLKAKCAVLGLPTNGRRQELYDSLVDYLRDGARVRDLVSVAPDGAAELLHKLVWEDSEIRLGHSIQHTHYAQLGSPLHRETPANWVIDRGLVYPSYSGVASMPLEIGLALRGRDYHLPFTPDPPQVALCPVAPERVATESSAAALRLLDRVVTVVGSAAVEAIPLIKTGRIGARTIAKLAKELGAEIDEIRVALDLAGATGLLAVEIPMMPESSGRGRRPASKPPEFLHPSDDFPRFRELDAAAQLTRLLRSWWDFRWASTADEKTVRATLGEDPHEAHELVRHLAVRLLAGLEPGTGLIDPEQFAALAAWHLPAISGDILRVLVAATLTEARIVGVSASYAASDLAFALLRGNLEQAAETAVSNACGSALFGTDLTAIVTGPPSTELANLLDRVADRETQGSASTWRFSPASVRRAYDNGASLDGVLETLRAVARGELPQPLTYLLNDVARRHGEVGVTDVGCVVVGEDPALLAEIAAHRKLAKLGLRAIAPTVLTSTMDAATTLAALRDSGYAPVHRADDGTVVIREERIAPPPEPEYALPSPQVPAKPEDPYAHADRLIAATGRPPKPLKRGALMNVFPGKRTAAWVRLILQLESGFPVIIGYQGETLVVSDPELDGDYLDVWLPKLGEYRRLDVKLIMPT
ncbi:helicase-associated domain-containing protein [Amycolatopsis sp. cg5]|uniref:helicase-associated domain-containing protein n=1 Tax=Amycolatopsis sp. cg5 TaxID=3238802 RepID=UPI00352549D2